MKSLRALVALSLLLGVLGLAPTAAGAAPAITSIDPGGGVNTGPSQVTIRGTGFVPGSRVTFVEIHPLSGAVETAVDTSGGTVSADGKTISGITIPTTGLAPTKNASPPTYSGDVSWFLRVTNPDNSTSTSTEFDLLGEQPALNTVSPSAIKQGETKMVTFRGVNFARRAAITLNQAAWPDSDNPGYRSGDPITFSEVTWKGLNEYTAKVTVPSDYPLGKRNVKLANTDGKSSTCNGCLEVLAKTPTKVPTVKNISPSSETNADSKSAVNVSITGTNFNDKGSIEAALVGWCPDGDANCAMNGRVIEVDIDSVTQGDLPTDDDTIAGTVNLVLEAPGRYSVRVSNTGAAGGSSTLPNDFQIFANPPTISSPSNAFPQSLKSGEAKTFKVSGSNFAKGDMVIIPDAKVSQVAVVSRDELRVSVIPNDNIETGRRSLTVRHTNGNQSSCSECVLIRTSTPTVDRYIEAVHQLFLGRAATTSDLSRWRSTVQSGNRETLTRSLANSEEFAGVQIDLLYREILGRPSDSTGRAHWLEQVRKGTRLDEIASYFYGSREYFQANGSDNRKFVRALYRDILGRPAEKDGEDHWTEQLDKKRLTRSEVAAAGFYAGIESRRQRVTQQYQLVLDRNPDASGREYWAEQIRTLGDIVLASFLAASQEYYDKVTKVGD